MSAFEEFSIDSSAGKKLYALRCVPAGPVKGIVQIAHGIADHIDRYRELMAFLAENGFLAVGNDHLGHGKNITCAKDQGIFCEHDGWRHVVQDLALLHDLTASEYPGAPYILYGHSMGSFLTRTFLADYPEKYDMAILSGTGHPAGAAVIGGHALARMIVRLKGYASDGRMLEKLAMGSYNRGVKAPRTGFDWISSDPRQVDRYIEDPMCGFTAKSGVYADMMGGIAYITSPDTIARVPHDKPIFLISGSDDPVGDYGKGVAAACSSYQRAGITDVSMKLYPGARHEIHNDVCQEEVQQDILNWIREHITAKEAAR